MRAEAGFRQRGGFVMGLVAGLLIGLALALGVALYITKAPVPFLNKVPLRTAEQDTAEAERNRTWDPNAPLAGKASQRSAAAAAAAASAATAGIAAPAVVAGPAAGVMAGPGAAPPTRDPSAILAGGPTQQPFPSTPAQPQTQPQTQPRSGAPILDPFVYFIQAGAYTRSEDAEQQRARLAMMGQAARITEREQAGRTVYRVRVGPFASRDEADGLQNKLQEQSIEAQIVRVEKP